METLMTDAMAPSPDQSSLLSSVEEEIGNLAKHEGLKNSSPLENNADRMRASLGRLSSTSIGDLEALTAELKRMQDFVKSEVESVHRQIEGALAGINIIIETISPWKNIVPANTLPTPPAPNFRTFRGAPAANVEAAPVRRMAEG
jgi:hypothetical protein